MKNWVVYPEEVWRTRWELFIALLLLFVCVNTPLSLAFERVDDTETQTWRDIVDVELFVDIIFLVDIIMNFHFAFYNSDFELIDDKKRIALSYVKGWFIVDFLAIIPLDKIFKGAGSFN